MVDTSGEASGKNEDSVAVEKPFSRASMRREIPFLSRLISLLLIIPTAFFLIFTAILSVVEISSRVTAGKFLEYKIGVINEQLATEAVSGFYSGSDRERNVASDNQKKINQLIDNKNFYQKQKDLLSYLEFSGADADSYTVYSIQKNIEMNEKRLSITPIIDKYQEENSTRSMEISNVQSEILRIEKIYNRLSSDVIRQEMSEGDVVAIFRGYISDINKPGYRFDDYFYDSLNERFPFESDSKFFSYSSGGYKEIQDDISKSLEDYLEVLARQVEHLRSRIESEVINIDRLKEDLENASSGEGNAYGMVGWIRTRFDSFRSDVLLAVSLVCCGGIGSVVAGMRRNSFQPGSKKLLDEPWFIGPRDILLGFSAGFVAFLVIKGGKSLFLIQGVESSAELNPYGCALAGILAGLFTEKAYQLLSAMIDQAANTIARRDNEEDSQVSKGEQKR